MQTVTLPDDLAESFRMIAKEAGQTLHECVVAVMRQYLEEMEERQDIADARLALKAYERDGGGCPWEQVKQELGLG